VRTRLSVVLCFVLASVAVHAQQGAQNGVVRLDPSLDALISPGAKAELLKGDYFGALEGPVWIDDGPAGFLLFSDMAANVIYKWTPAGQLSVFLEKSGYTGNDINNVGGQYTNGRLHLLNIGSNGLTVDREGRRRLRRGTRASGSTARTISW
jgi:gluconolactonase